MQQITVEGKYGTKVTVLLDSRCPKGFRFITFVVEYSRTILAELNTHRALSKNSASSRAIPFKKMVEQLNGRPVRFGQANPGMQDKGEDYDGLIRIQSFDGETCDFTPEEVWGMAKTDAVSYSGYLNAAGYHKQVYNRLTEPFQMMKTVLSGTELANFFWLRDDKAADPTLAELACCMREAAALSTPTQLRPGEWHLPYVEFYQEDIGKEGDTEWGPPIYFIGDMITPGGDGQVLTLEQAIKMSCARCAAVSYRNEDYGLEKCIELYDRLVGDEKKHASALEHCATPMAEEFRIYDGSNTVGDINVPYRFGTWEPGITHVDRKGQLWSGNIRGWIQYRKLVPGENVEGGV